MDLRGRASFVIKMSLENIDRAANETEIKAEINQLKQQLELLSENESRDLANAIRLRGSAMPEVIQNLKIDRNNWGCARTGFIYNGRGRLDMTPIHFLNL